MRPAIPPILLAGIPLRTKPVRGPRRPAAARPVDSLVTILQEYRVSP